MNKCDGTGDEIQFSILVSEDMLLFIISKFTQGILKLCITIFHRISKGHGNEELDEILKKHDLYLQILRQSVTSTKTKPLFGRLV